MPKAHLIHGQAYSATENNNDETLFRCSALKLFPKLTAVECHRSGGSSSSPLGLHVHAASTTSPPSHSLPLCFPHSLVFLPHDSQARISILYHKPQDQSSTPASPAPTAPQGSAWAIISLLSYHTLTDEGPGTTIPFPTRTQQCCAGLSQQLRGQRRKYSSSQPCSSVRSRRSYRATPLSCTAHQSRYCMLCSALGSSDWL